MVIDGQPDSVSSSIADVRIRSRVVVVEATASAGAGLTPRPCHHHEVDLLAHSAVRAGPGVGHGRPGRARWEALALVASRDDVDVAAAWAARRLSVSAAAPRSGLADPADGVSRARVASAEKRSRIRLRLRGAMFASETSPSRCATTRGSITRRHSTGTSASRIIPA